MALLTASQETAMNTHSLDDKLNALLAGAGIVLALCLVVVVATGGSLGRDDKSLSAAVATNASEAAAAAQAASTVRVAAH
jgi:hypothetical protein